MKLISQQEQVLLTSQATDRSLRFLPKEIKLITTSYKWKKHTSNHLVSTAIDLIDIWGESCFQNLVPSLKWNAFGKAFISASLFRLVMLKEMYSVIFTTSPWNITIYIFPIMKLQGLIIKGIWCQSLNSDFPVVSPLGSISSWIQGSLSLQSNKAEKRWDNREE